MRALYLSHNGMLEPLGQSQVLPYLRGLAHRGIEFDLLSFEQADADGDAVAELGTRLRDVGIHWLPLRRARDPRLRVKVREATEGVLRAGLAALRRRPSIVHGRSYLPTAIADAIATTLPGAKLLFDCRGMLGDEYVDSGYWTTDRFDYRLLKRYESRAFRRAEGIVVLTHALRRWLVGSGKLGAQARVETIPCCVDLERFAFDGAARARVRGELGLTPDHLVLVYSGSLGGLYRERDLARFTAVVKRRARRAVALLVLTQSRSEPLLGMLAAEGLAASEVFVLRAPPEHVASYLSAGDAAMVFGKSCFARMGCSPTKLPEYLACGLPVIANDFGDQSELAVEADMCVVIDSFDDEALAAAADRLVEAASAPKEDRVRRGRRIAETRFGLETVGIPKYEALYRALAVG